MPDPFDPILIRHLAPKNFLSFGPDNAGVELKALNLFIGPNGCGKSNLIEAVNLMRSAPKEMRDVTRKGGGVAEWIWKGGPKNAASVEWVVKSSKGPALRHVVSFRAMAQAFSLEDERVHHQSVGHKDDFLYQYRNGRPILYRKHLLSENAVEADRSILAQRRDPEAYPELAWLAQNYERVRIYREWTFGQSAVFREPQKADMRNDALEEDFSNLGLFLNRLKTRFPAAKKE